MSFAKKQNEMAIVLSLTVAMLAMTLSAFATTPVWQSYIAGANEEMGNMIQTKEYTTAAGPHHDAFERYTFAALSELEKTAKTNKKSPVTEETRADFLSLVSNIDSCLQTKLLVIQSEFLPNLDTSAQEATKLAVKEGDYMHQFVNSVKSGKLSEAEHSRLSHEAFTQAHEYSKQSSEQQKQSRQTRSKTELAKAQLFSWGITQMARARAAIVAVGGASDPSIKEADLHIKEWRASYKVSCDNAKVT